MYTTCSLCVTCSICACPHTMTPLFFIWQPAAFICSLAFSAETEPTHLEINSRVPCFSSWYLVSLSYYYQSLWLNHWWRVIGDCCLHGFGGNYQAFWFRGFKKVALSLGHWSRRWVLDQNLQIRRKRKFPSWICLI